LVKTFRVHDDFHGWVTAQSMKGESYEDVLKRLTGYKQQCLDEWIRRVYVLPLELQRLVIEDVKAALRNRIKVMERINKKL